MNRLGRLCIASDNSIQGLVAALLAHATGKVDHITVILDTSKHKHVNSKFSVSGPARNLLEELCPDVKLETSRHEIHVKKIASVFEGCISDWIVNDDFSITPTLTTRYVAGPRYHPLPVDLLVTFYTNEESNTKFKRKVFTDPAKVTFTHIKVYEGIWYRANAEFIKVLGDLKSLSICDLMPEGTYIRKCTPLEGGEYYRIAYRFVLKDNPNDEPVYPWSLVTPPPFDNCWDESQFAQQPAPYHPVYVAVPTGIKQSGIIIGGAFESLPMKAKNWSTHHIHEAMSFAKCIQEAYTNEDCSENVHPIEHVTQLFYERATENLKFLYENQLQVLNVMTDPEAQRKLQYDKDYPINKVAVQNFIADLKDLED